MTRFFVRKMRVVVLLWIDSYEFDNKYGVIDVHRHDYNRKPSGKVKIKSWKNA